MNEALTSPPIPPSPLPLLLQPIIQSSLGEVVQEEYSDYIQSLSYRDLIQVRRRCFSLLSPSLSSPPARPSSPPFPFQVLELAHFLVLEPLLRLALARLHFVLKATPLEEFKRLFLFQNDLTPEEEAVGREGGREGRRVNGGEYKASKAAVVWTEKRDERGE